MDKTLVDTSAWIEFFRKKEPCHGTVVSLMADRKICCLGIVLAELVQGVTTDAELEVLRDFVHVFDFLPESVDSWREAGELSRRLRRKGKTVGLSDCYIAVAARVNKARVLTLDKHFEMLKDIAAVDVHPLLFGR